jgi:RNA polymerase sigma factor (sigma-70 family)
VETSLRARVRAGEPDAFRELFDAHVRSVYNHGFRLVGSWSVAEDVVSLTFLEAWRLRGRVEPGPDGGSLRPWLLGIATNVARNVRRAARRYDIAVARLPGADVVPDFAEEVADRVDDRARLERALAVLATLRTAEREVVALCVWSGLDYAEAAEALGVPIGTVRSRLSRARAKLAALLGEPPGPAREPPGRLGQVSGDRDNAVRLAQEKTR